MLDLDLAAKLLARARAAAERAYAPYSQFPVGAAILTDDGSIFEGANIENASYPVTMCAERVAAGAAVFAGHRAFRAVAVSAPRAPGATPCGVCRQLLNEFKPAAGELIVILDGANSPEQMPLSALLPRAFGPRDLE
ncbi:MAG TPA: cytidine deaminase [Thermomicrobiales bacterium]|nr:cytidine deaminase [Thermomicrobiales bacterium]